LEQAVMTYISYYRDLAPITLNDASKCRAYGPGLVEAIVSESTEFFVETPANTKGKLEIKVEGPKSTAQVKLTPMGPGKYKVEYEPKEVGEYRIHVTLDQKHIPGSIFHVTVLENLSLGGEGKILVFYSTTSAKNEYTRPMQEFLEKKKIHLRPDFEPWIPVDVMEPKDRDAVFKKAGTKDLPIVYIDDKFIGGFLRLQELEKSGELDRLLKYNEKTGQSGNAPLVDKAPVSVAPRSKPTTAAPVVVQTDASSDAKEDDWLAMKKKTAGKK